MYCGSPTPSASPTTALRTAAPIASTWPGQNKGCWAYIRGGTLQRSRTSPTVPGLSPGLGTRGVRNAYVILYGGVLYWRLAVIRQTAAPGRCANLKSERRLKKNETDERLTNQSHIAAEERRKGGRCG
eukprot:1177727-Prorocentrum_minimum.AAC.3